MKIILFLLVFFPIYSQSGDFRGHITDRDDEKSGFPGAIITLSKDNKAIYYAQSDFYGNFTIKNVIYDEYEFKISTIGYPELIIKQFLFRTNDRIFQFVYPNPCVPSIKKCPENHTDNIIPIVYGLPNKKMIRKAERKKIFLGGCLITGCDPEWYCPKHKLTF